MCNKPLKNNWTKKTTQFLQTNVFRNCTITTNYQSALSLTDCRSISTHNSSSLSFLQECACLCVHVRVYYWKPHYITLDTVAWQTQFLFPKMKKKTKKARKLHCLLCVWLHVSGEETFLVRLLYSRSLWICKLRNREIVIYIFFNIYFI